MLIFCRAAVVFGLLLTLLAPRAGWAVEIDILSKVIGADTAASVTDPLGIIVPADVDDDPANTSTIAATHGSLARLTDILYEDPDLGLRNRFGEAISEATNVGASTPTLFLFDSTVVIAGRGDKDFDEVAQAEAFGDVEFRIEEASAGAGTEAFVEIRFEDVDLTPDIGTVSVSVLLNNLTLGTVLFDSDTDGFPEVDELSGARVGDVLELVWSLELVGDIPDGSATGRADLRAAIEVTAIGDPLPVPEPSLGFLLLACLFRGRSARARA